MKISIIGKGNVGAALQTGLERTGHEVRAVGRNPADVRDAAASADLLVLAVPYGEIDDVVALLEGLVDGKILIDATNALTPDFGLAIGFDASGAELLQKKLPAAKVVKAFNTAFAGTMASGSVKGQQLAGLAAGDDAEAKKVVLNLMAGLGFDPIDAGPLEAARLMEPLALLTIKLGLVQGFGPDIGFRLVH